MNQTITTQPTKVTFTAEQQAKLTEIIAERVAAAGREGREAAEVARKEAAQLRSELAALKTQALAPVQESAILDSELEPSQPSTEAIIYPTVAESANELETARRELSELRQRAESDSIRFALIEAARSVNTIDPTVAADLLSKSVKTRDGQLEVVTESGTPRLNERFEPMTVPELLNRFAAERPYLIRSSVQSGTGATEASHHPRFNPDADVSRLFGRGSDGRAANALAMRDKQEYTRLKEVARKRGLI
jgi:hypothetical protein